VHNEDEQITQRKVRVITEMMRKGLGDVQKKKKINKIMFSRNFFLITCK